MKVKDLALILETQNPEATVVLRDGDDTWYYVLDKVGPKQLLKEVERGLIYYRPVPYDTPKDLEKVVVLTS